MTKIGSLTVVGLGIQIVRQTTPEAIHEIKHAEKLFYLPADSITVQWLHELNSTAESSSVSLAEGYTEGRHRQTIYEEWVEHVLTYVRSGFRVCVAIYGHPGVFVFAGHEAIRRAIQEGYPAIMLPAISAEDCLFADLGIDPRQGCQSFEATDFIVCERRIDVRSSLILWQIGVLGQNDYQKSYSSGGVLLLVEVLQTWYNLEHEVVVYEASTYPICKPRIESIPLSQLSTVHLSSRSTLYIPPLYKPEINEELADRLRKMISPPLKAELAKPYSSILSTAAERELLPSIWRKTLRRDGFFTCNIGLLNDTDLKSVAWEVATLNECSSVGDISAIEVHLVTEYRSFTSQDVLFHNDGLSSDVPPRYVILYCETPSVQGGETLLIKSSVIAERMEPNLYDFLLNTPIHIHIGGYAATRYLLINSPDTNETNFFFVDPKTITNCTLSVNGRLLDDQILEKIRQLLMDSKIICHKQKWQSHDLLLIDNYHVLHGRNSYQGKHRLLKHIPVYPSKSLNPILPR
jgi:Taurine catabolism dioxygenase TauD, TfdA family/Tetrapyrrole (Corrin/Porphyrin) Methylases